MNPIEKLTFSSGVGLARSQISDSAYSMPSVPPEESASGLWKLLSSSEMALAEIPNLEHFSDYQKNVRRLLQSGLSRYVVRAETYRSPQGRFQHMVYVTAVDRELEQLRQELLAGHVGTGILRHFDAIRGLLLDVFT